MCTIYWKHSILCGEYQAIMPATGCEDAKPHSASSFTEPSTCIWFAHVWQSHVSMQVAHNVHHIQGPCTVHSPCTVHWILHSLYNWRLEERMQWPCHLSDLFLWWHYFLCLLFLGVVVCCLIPPTFVASIAWRHCMLLLAVMCALWCERRATRHCCTSECGTHDYPDSAASHLTVNVSMWL